jgi:hypothetical protein
LARLAELDMPRHIEVLSCVSGGSILGAFYYLELRKILQENTDRNSIATTMSNWSIVSRRNSYSVGFVPNSRNSRVSPAAMKKQYSQLSVVVRKMQQYVSARSSDALVIVKPESNRLASSRLLPVLTLAIPIGRAAASER